MRIASTLLVLGVCAGCVTGLGIPLEYTATINSTLYLKAELESLYDTELSDIQRTLIALAATDRYVKDRDGTLAQSYLELVGLSGGQEFGGEVGELIEMVRLLEIE